MRKFLILILALSVFFRFYDLHSVPSWDWDEGVNLNVIRNLLDGRFQLFSVKYTFFPHPPLFFIVGGMMIKLFGYELYSLRLMTAFYGVLTALLVYAISTKMFGRRVGITAGLLYALYPSAIYFSRIGFANNQVVLLSAFSVYAIYSYLRNEGERWLYVASIANGTAIITEYTAVAGLVASSYLLLKYKKETLPKFLLVSLLLPLTVLSALFLMSSDSLVYDILVQVRRVSTPFFFLVASLTVVAMLTIYKFGNFIREFFRVFTSNLNEVTVPAFVMISIFSLKLHSGGLQLNDDMFYGGVTYLNLMGLLSVFLILPTLKKSIERSALSAYTIGYLLLLLALNRADHMLMFIYPYTIMLLGLLIEKTYVVVREFTKENNINPVILVIMAYHPLFFIFVQDVQTFVIGNAIGSTHESDFLGLVDYLNNRTEPNDVILTYSFLEPYLKGKTCTVIESIAYEGQSIKYYPGDIDRDRFVFNCSYKYARYITMTNGTRDNMLDGKEYENLSDYLETLEYDVVGNFFVYKRDI
ncbi:MAG: glycosyltransferase family 39 protein [Candidatus Altiarchaeota archaeon]